MICQRGIALRREAKASEANKSRRPCNLRKADMASATTCVYKDNKKTYFLFAIEDVKLVLTGKG